MKRSLLIGLPLLVLAIVGVTLSAGRFFPQGEVEARTPARTVSYQSPDANPQPTLATIPAGLVTLRVELRSRYENKKKLPTTWDGSLDVSSGSVRQIRLWQEDPRNRITGNTWKLTTQRTIPWNAQQRARGHEAMPLMDGALIIELTGSSPSTKLNFKTTQGDFSVALKEIGLSAKTERVRGLVRISRAANTAIVVASPTEDDYPAAALGPDGKLRVAYVAFTHGTGYQARPPVLQPLKGSEFDRLDEPTGGDQVVLITLDGDTWSEPVAVTPPGQDIYRTAVAVDDKGRTWVVWSVNQQENWDILARCLDGDTWSDVIRVSSDPGPDSFPVATTDSSGNVWIAWQAFRDGEADILAVRQQGDKLSRPMIVADAPGNQWAPAIAASDDGQVAVAWDSYTKGDYDVSCRIASGGKFGTEIVVADSLMAQMRPSITFDGQNRLWIAYEESPENWGKDWGPMDKYAQGLYMGRTIACRVWADSQLWQAPGDPAAAFTAGIQGGGGKKLAVPRLTTDAKGRVWMAVRSGRLGSRVGVGTAWFEHVSVHDGQDWSPEIICPQTDNILDNRPAMVGMPNGQVAMIGSTDERFTTGSKLPYWFIRELQKGGEKIQNRQAAQKYPDPVNNELMMATLGPVPGELKSVKLEAIPTADATPASLESKQEAQEVAQARAVRTTTGGKNLQIVRGEFHRHTELSSDGGGDGLLLDMWRYGIDAAGMDWIGNGDHDNGNGREYSWWTVQKTTSLFQIPGAFSPMYTYERSCTYPDGHRNVVFDRRGIRPLPRLNGGMGEAMDSLPVDDKRPNTPDTLMLYDYLRHFDGVCAGHTSGTDMGTDWRDNDPKVEPIVEIYQGCRQSYEMPGAPRSNTAEYSLGGWRPFGFVSLALKKGYRLGFQASSDHTSTHISYCNVWAEDHSRSAILKAMKARHVYGATDNIVADVQCGPHFMGDEFTTDEKPRLSIHLIGTEPFAKVHVIKDGNYVHSASPGTKEVRFEWTDFAPEPDATSYYYVRGEQEDGELVWVSPMWITYSP